jgi:hypothetical protein
MTDLDYTSGDLVFFTHLLSDRRIKVVDLLGVFKQDEERAFLCEV